MCNSTQSKDDEPQAGSKRREVVAGGGASPQRRMFITNFRWTIGLLSTINFMVIHKSVSLANCTIIAAPFLMLDFLDLWSVCDVCEYVCVFLCW